jgi:hypothetical protein
LTKFDKFYSSINNSLTSPKQKWCPISKKVNPSTPQLKGWGLLRVDPEWRFSTPPSNAGLGAVEWVKGFLVGGKREDRERSRN